MNELVDMVVKKTGIPAATAQKAVNVVIDYLKKKLPAPVAGQIDAALSGGGAMKTASELMGKLGGGGKKK